MTIGTVNGLVFFNDGEEVVEGDFNDLQNCLTGRAWELPGLADMTAFDQFGQTYAFAFDNGYYGLFGRAYGVFTKGGGLLPSCAGLVSSMAGGMIGTWNNGFYGSPRTPSTLSRSIRWAYVGGATAWSHTHAATSSGQYRIDIVTCKIDEAASGILVSRSFQDATTGALTTVDVDKQTVLTLDLDASTAVTAGTESASDATVTIPAIPSGRRLLYYVMVHNSTMTAYDCTIPAGSLITGITLPVNAAIYRAGAGLWTEDYTLIGGLVGPSATGAATAFCVPPPSMTGDPSVRILGAYVFARLNSEHTVKVESNTSAGAWSPTTLADITALFTRDGQYHSTLIDLRGLPHSASSLPAVKGLGPVWANGGTTKAKVTTGDSNTIGITFRSSTVPLSIGAITWYAVRG